MDHRPDGLALLVGHDGELDGHRVDAVEGGDRLVDGALDLGLEGTAGHGEGDGDGDAAAVDGDAGDHVEVDDGAAQFGVLNGPEGFDDLGFGGGHGVPGTRAEGSGPAKRGRRPGSVG